MNSVQNATLQNSTTFAGTTYWSGYQFNVKNSYATYATWIIPRVFAPPTNNECNNGLNLNCKLAIWTGESASGGGGSAFAQGGSVGNVFCTVYRGIATCSDSYWLWYEFDPAPGSPSFDCHSASFGDTVFGEMSNYGGADTIYLYDYTNGGACSVNKVESMPQWEQFIAEFPTWVACYTLCSGYYVLPKYGSFNFYDAGIDGTPISDLCSPCYVSTMNNGPNGQENINLGQISYSQSLQAYFAEPWVTSSGT